MRSYIVLFLLLAQTSCSYFFEEKEVSEETSLRLGLESQCLSEFFSTQYDFIRNEASYQQAVGNINCVQSSLESIGDLVQQHLKKETLKQDEVHLLLNQFFFKDRPINYELIDSALTIKSWLVGGLPDELNQSELKQVIALLEHWEKFVVNTHSLIPILNWEKGQGDEVTFQNAFTQVGVELGIFLDHWPEKIEPFSIDVVKDFVAEIEEVSGEQSLLAYVDLFHGIVWLINGKEDRLVIKKTVLAFFEFLSSYRSYTYQFGWSVVEILDHPTEFARWLDETIALIGKVLGDDYVLPIEGLELIVGFLMDY